ncbi:vWA domain-containing protein [Paracoccus methylarcula]|uniref:VWA domain-containing protein n=1 Tax=Paracoccus methylarcula TaxID=72022 RepID=A0A422QZQ0_9RHOB|nr:vWA domain-containing protein [Paracoccus methylarcula]RNF35431.1 VWA domain-containing protein [Paracoccus methylarcula]
MRQIIRNTVFALSTLVLAPAGALAQQDQSATEQTGSQQVQVAFVLDTTGSMADLIEGAKQKIWSIANTILDVNPDADISMALIGYRDRGDEYVVKPHPLTRDVQGLYSKLRRFNADGGGDTPESVNEALDAAVRGQDWAEGDHVRRIIFLVGDAPPHMDYANAPRYAEVIAAARDKGIIVNTIQAGSDPETREYWQEMARLGGGRYHPIPQDGGQVVQIQTPYDDQINQIQLRIDATVVPYGSSAKQSELEDKIAERAEAPASVRADNSSFYAKKTGREVVTGGGDLVAAIDNGSITLDGVAEAELPPALRGMSTEERAAHLQQKLEERRELETELAGLVDKRDTFIAEQGADADDQSSFDKSVRVLLKEQLN